MQKIFTGAFVLVATITLSTSTFAYDYINDVLVGNTVEITNAATGKTTTYKVKADKTVARTMDGVTVVGTWSSETNKVCATYPGENNGQPQCSDIPKETVTVPGERETELPNPTAGQPPIKLKIKYITGQ